MYREARVSTFSFTMKNEGLQRKARVTTFLVQKKKKKRGCVQRGKIFNFFGSKIKTTICTEKHELRLLGLRKKNEDIYRDARVSTFLRCECTFLSGTCNAHGGKDSSGGNTEFWRGVSLLLKLFHSSIS